MLKQTRRITQNLRNNLIKPAQQPIGKAALIVVILLDLFMLLSIYSGLSVHTDQLVQPDEQIPQHCRAIVIAGSWNDTDRLIHLARRTDSRDVQAEPIDENRLHSACLVSSRLITQIGASATVEDLNALLNLNSEIQHAQTRLQQARQAARPAPHSTDPAPLSAAVGRAAADYNALFLRRSETEAALNQQPLIVSLFTYIDSLGEEDKKALAAELDTLQFWYPVKREAMQMLFLLPLLLIFGFWNLRSIDSNKSLQILLSSHLLVVAFIPLLFNVLNWLYRIIPKQLLQQLFDLLVSLRLVALWHYFLMGGAILVALAIIYTFHNRLFPADKLAEKRIAKGQCQGCGGKLPPASRVCSRCGFKQFHNCAHCAQPTYVQGRYCIGCGAEQLPLT